MTFAQRRNGLKTHFSERIPVVKRRMTALKCHIKWLTQHGTGTVGNACTMCANAYKLSDCDYIIHLLGPYDSHNAEHAFL